MPSHTITQLSPSQQTHKRSKDNWVTNKISLLGVIALTTLLLPFLNGCGLLPTAEAEAQSQSSKAQQGGGVTPVDVVIARTGSLKEELEYIGTTRPVREVSLSSQVEGRLLKLQVDVGDPVRQGQILAQLNDSSLAIAVTQAQAELAALQSEVARARTQVSNARARAEQAKVELQQAKADAARLSQLRQAGAISKQEAELAQTAARTNQQAVLAAQEQIATEQQTVAAAQGRFAAQQAVVAESRERLSYARLASPITGVVLQKVTEPGNLVQPGGEVLKLGDFSRVKVVVPVSELELSKIRVGQAVKVRLDAFSKQEFFGEVARISPAADVSARQLSVEVTIPNNSGQITSGLLARVSFATTNIERVLVPQTALQAAGEGKVGAYPVGRPKDVGSVGRPEQGRSQSKDRNDKDATLFVVTTEGTQATVQARVVTLGERGDGKVEIVSGLKPGERFVSRSGKPLKDRETVRLSILSEK